MYSVGPVQYHIALDGSVFALDKRRILKNNFSIQDQCPQGLSVNPLRKRLVLLFLLEYCLVLAVGARDFKSAPCKVVKVRKS